MDPAADQLGLPSTVDERLLPEDGVAGSSNTGIVIVEAGSSRP
jgi:hypothetical protein